MDFNKIKRILEKDRPITATIIVIAVSLTFTLLTSIEKKKTILDGEILDTVDTMIPTDHTLFPVEIENQDALEAMTDSFAVVDVFVRLTSGQVKKVISSVKLISAPLNPSEFALLIPNGHDSVIPFLINGVTVSIRPQDQSKFQVHLHEGGKTRQQNVIYGEGIQNDSNEI
jgi:hypothetical protein